MKIERADSVRFHVMLKEGGKTPDSEVPKKISVDSGTIFAGNLKTPAADTPADKKAKAQKEALRGVVKQLARDVGIGDELAQRAENREELGRDSTAAGEGLKQVRKNRRELMDSYGMKPDSEEEKELREIESHIDMDRLTPEQLDYVMEPMTEYQKMAFKHDRELRACQNQSNKARSGRINEGLSIEATKLSLLKTHPMMDEMDEKKEKLEEASSEIISELVKDAKDSTEEKLDEIKENVEKQKEKNEECRERPGTEEAEIEQLTRTTVEMEQRVETIIKEIKAEGTMTEEELKGLAVDSLL